MEYILVGGREYLKVKDFAEAIGVSLATVYNWRKAGHLRFEQPLGPTLTFVDRQTVEKYLRMRITAAMGAFIQSGLEVA